MKSIFMVAGGALLLAALVVGCGSKETYTTPEGTVTVERQGDSTRVTVEGEEGTVEAQGETGKMTVTSEHGTSVVETGLDAAEADIGMPLYPGAKVEQTLKHTDDEGHQMAQVHLSTPDSFAKVKAFYREELPKAQAAGDVETPDLKVFQLMWQEEGEQRMVVVSRDKSDTLTRVAVHRMQAEE